MKAVLAALIVAVAHIARAQEEEVGASADSSQEQAVESASSKYDGVLPQFSDAAPLIQQCDYEFENARKAYVIDVDNSLADAQASYEGDKRMWENKITDVDAKIEKQQKRQTYLKRLIDNTNAKKAKAEAIIKDVVANITEFAGMKNKLKAEIEKVEGDIGKTQAAIETAQAEITKAEQQAQKVTDDISAKCSGIKAEIQGEIDVIKATRQNVDAQLQVQKDIKAEADKRSQKYYKYYQVAGQVVAAQHAARATKYVCALWAEPGTCALSLAEEATTHASAASVNARMSLMRQDAKMLEEEEEADDLDTSLAALFVALSEGEMETGEADNAKLEARVDVLRSGILTCVDTIEVQYKAAKAKMVTWLQEIDQLRETHATKHATANELVQDVKDLITEVSTLAETFKKISAQKAALIQAQEKLLLDVNSLSQDLDNRKAELKESLSVLRARIDELNVEAAELAAAEKKLSELTRANAGACGDDAALIAELEASRGEHHTALQAAQAEIPKAQKEAEAATAQAGVYKKHLERALSQTKIAGLSAEVGGFETGLLTALNQQQTMAAQYLTDTCSAQAKAWTDLCAKHRSGSGQAKYGTFDVPTGCGANWDTKFNSDHDFCRETLLKGTKAVTGYNMYVPKHVASRASKIAR